MSKHLFGSSQFYGGLQLPLLYMSRKNTWLSLPPLSNSSFLFNFRTQTEVLTCNVSVAMKNNIELCTASDFCAINCHAFFDGNTLAEEAGSFVSGWVKQISEAAGGKTTIVSESGWPHQGDPNNKAIPSPENQAAAIASLKAAFGGGSNLVLYNSYNDLWKSDSAGTFGSVIISQYLSSRLRILTDI